MKNHLKIDFWQTKSRSDKKNYRKECFVSLWLKLDTFDNISSFKSQTSKYFGTCQGFFLGGMGVPPYGENFVNPPIRHMSPFLDQGLYSPAEVRPRKFEKFEYIFVSNLTTFKLKSTLRSCISCLK